MAKARKKAKAKAKPKVKVSPKPKPKPKAKKTVRTKAPKVVVKKSSIRKAVKPKALIHNVSKKESTLKPAPVKAAPAKAASRNSKTLPAKTPLAKTVPAPKKELRVEAPKPEAPPPVSPVPRKEQREIREKLTALLEQLQHNIQGGVKAAGERDLAHIVDTSDMASDSAEGDLAFRIAESEGANATEVQKAIEKIDTDSYGICERCMKPIGMDRLHFLPFATQCIKCQELAEIRRTNDDEAELDDLVDAIDDGQEEA